MRRKKVLFTSTLSSTFILEDLRLLQKYYDVTHLQTSGFIAPLRILSALRSHDVTFTWFASVYAFFPVFLGRLIGRKSVVVIGGADASKIPEIRYGIWLSPWKALLVKWTLRHAHAVLAVDPSLQKEAARLADYDGENITYVPTGYDPSLWKPAGPKVPSVLTVAACQDQWRMKKKGLDVLFDAARTIPDVRFVVVGIRDDLIGNVRASVPANVELIPFVEQSRLLKYYQDAAVYCQPSCTEGLPNSLCEGMLCGCVPVGSNVGGIPTAVADIGFLVPYGDAAALAEAIRSALNAPADTGRRAREYIARTFTLDRREAALHDAIEKATR